MGKKKIAVIAVLSGLAALITLAGLIVWQHTTALELFPEEIWAERHELLFHRSFGSDAVVMEASGEELQTAFSGAELWRVPDPGWGFPGYPSFFLYIPSEQGEYWIFVGENGYILSGQRDALRQERFAWYRDDGSLFRTLDEMPRPSAGE